MSKDIQLYEVTSDTVRIAAPNHISAGTFNGVARNGILLVGASVNERREIAKAILRSIGDEAGYADLCNDEH
jgi:hypothetical protein